MFWLRKNRKRSINCWKAIQEVKSIRKKLLRRFWEYFKGWKKTGAFSKKRKCAKKSNQNLL